MSEATRRKSEYSITNPPSRSEEKRLVKEMKLELAKGTSLKGVSKKLKISRYLCDKLVKSHGLKTRKSMRIEKKIFVTEHVALVFYYMAGSGLSASRMSELCGICRTVARKKQQRMGMQPHDLSLWRREKPGDAEMAQLEIDFMAAVHGNPEDAERTAKAWVDRQAKQRMRKDAFEAEARSIEAYRQRQAEREREKAERFKRFGGVTPAQASALSAVARYAYFDKPDVSPELREHALAWAYSRLAEAERGRHHAEWGSALDPGNTVWLHKRDPLLLEAH